MLELLATFQCFATARVEVVDELDAESAEAGVDVDADLEEERRVARFDVERPFVSPDGRTGWEVGRDDARADGVERLDRAVPHHVRYRRRVHLEHERVDDRRVLRRWHESRS